MTAVNSQGKPDRKLRFWQAHVRAWEKSGLSQREYCSRTEISSSQLCYWKKKLNDANGSSVSFVPVSVPACRSQGRGGAKNIISGLTILLRRDIRVELDQEFTEATLLKLLTVLGECR